LGAWLEPGGKKVIIANGADWIWKIANQYFPSAIQIVDIYHARPHLWDLARALNPNDETKQRRWVMRQQAKLDGGQTDKIVAALRSIGATTPELADKIRIETDYFACMRSPEFRRQHRFIGSSVIEAACKTVIGSRLKQFGMFWTVRRANPIIALRCHRLLATRSRNTGIPAHVLPDHSTEMSRTHSVR
jgi:hypothetical protein